MVGMPEGLEADRAAGSAWVGLPVAIAAETTAKLSCARATMRMPGGLRRYETRSGPGMVMITAVSRHPHAADQHIRSFSLVTAGRPKLDL